MKNSTRPKFRFGWVQLRLEFLEDRRLLSGGLDTTFDGDGRQTVDFGDDDRANAVLVQPDGKIVMAGSFDGGSSNFAVARLNADGSLDTTFSGDGKFDFTFGAVEFATSAALQSDGKIVVAGYTNDDGTNDFAAIRVNTNGTLDNTFNGTGSIKIDFGSDDRARAVVIQPDGKIVLAGSFDGGSSDFALARLNADGTIDNTFDTDGKFSFTFGGADFCNAIALQADGKYVLAGYSDTLGDNRFAIARVNPNATLDTTFDGDGLQTIDFGFDDRATGVVVQPDGKIVVGGTDDGGSPDFALARLNANGSLDTTFNETSSPTIFNGNGKLSFTFGAGVFGGVERCNAIALQPNGKIVMVGFTDAGGGGGPFNFAVARVNPNGTLDKSFDGDGKVTIDFGNNDQANAVALQVDGKIVVAGQTNPGGGADNNFAVARLLGANITFAAIGGQFGRVELYNLDATLLGGFFPFIASGYTDAISVAVGDVNSDGFDDLVIGATIGNPNVKVYSGANVQSGAFFNNPEGNLLADGFPYAINFNVGANVAAGDVNGDGYADVISGAVPGNPHVKVFDGNAISTSGFIPTDITTAVLAEGFPYGLSFNVGANVGAGDVNGDGYEDIVTGATAGNPHTKVFDARLVLDSGFLNDASMIAEYFPYALQFNVGAFVTIGDYNGDGYGDVITGASIGNPQVIVMDGADIFNGTFNPNTSKLDEFFAFALSQNIGVSVGSADFDIDGDYDVMVGTRGGTPSIKVFQGNLPAAATEIPAWTFGASNFSGPLYVGA